MKFPGAADPCHSSEAQQNHDLYPPGCVCLSGTVGRSKLCTIIFLFISGSFHLPVPAAWMAVYENCICVLNFPLWKMFTIYLWKHCNNKTLSIAFQFAVRADKIFLSQTELHTLGDAAGPTRNNKTLQRKAGAAQIGSETQALHSADLYAF